MAKTLDLYLDQGTDFVAVLPPVLDASGAVFNLTNHTVECQIRRSYAIKKAIVINSAITNAVGGIITLTLPKVQTAGLSPTRYVYDVVITNTSDFSIKVFDGLLYVNSGVTDKPSTSLVVPMIPEDYGGSLT